MEHHNIIALNDMPCAVLVLDLDFKINTYNNKFKALINIENNSVLQLSKIDFYLPDGQKFNVEKCLKQFFKRNTTDYGKSLILKSAQGGDTLLFLNAKLSQSSAPFYVITLCDISKEIPCIADAHVLINEGSKVLNRIIGQSEKIVELRKMITLAADSNANILISGESGTGKELIADAIHYTSERRHKPFVKVNCSALSETLLESELFGHIKGSFTGAYKDKTGKFEQAQGGTIFLDEISEISQALQVKLLRVIQEKTIEKVGSNTPVKVDMRIITATNKNLRESIQKNEFREDLFYRLNVFPIYTIPLRERKNDIPLLSNHFIEKFNETTKKSVKGISKDAYRLLMDYCWPGNVRELENVIEHAFVLVSNSIIDIFDFPQELRVIAYKEGICKKDDIRVIDTQKVNSSNDISKSKKGRLNINKDELLWVLENYGWNQSEAARKLGISRVALWKKMKKFGI